MNLLLTLDPARAERARQLAARPLLHIKFDFYGVKIQVNTNSPSLVDHLRLGYGFFEVTDTPSPPPSILALDAEHPHFAEHFEFLLPGRRPDGDHLLIPLPMKQIFLLRGQAVLAFYTVITLFGQVVAQLLESFTCLHAATIAHQGRGLILCGAARCGKSVLTSLLLQHGLDYTSDDVTLLSRRSLEVAPFPRAINIRNDYAALLQPLLGRARRKGRFRIVDEERILLDLGCQISENVQPTMLCFPRYVPESSMELQRLSPARTLVGLMRHRFHPVGYSLAKHTTADFETLAQMLDGISCYELLFSDPTAAADLLRDRILQESCGQ